MDELSLVRWSYRHDARFSLPEDSYAGWALLAAEAGAFDYEVVGVERGTAHPGEIVLCPPGRTLRRTERSDALSFWFFEFTGEVACGEGGGKATVRDRARLASTWAALSRPALETRWRAHLLRDLLYQWTDARDAATGAAVSPRDPLVARIAARVADGDVSLSEFAREAGLSPSQLSRRFKAAYGGVTLSEYRERARLERARHLLLDTDHTLDRIAEACGYRDGFYLSRVFTRRFGVRPSVYRRQNRV